jgi:U3 small nucleolar RNA-associated protein 20
MSIVPIVVLIGRCVHSLLPPLITDLSTLLLPALPQLLTTLIALTAPSPLVSANPKILQRVYDVLGALFRDLGREILSSSEKGGMSDVWEVVRRGLGAPAMPEVDVEMELAVIEPVAIVEESTMEEDDDEIDELSTPVASTSTQPLPPPVMIDTLPRNFRTTPQTRRLLGSAFSYLVRKARSGTGEEEGELEQLFRMMIEDVVNLEELDLGQRHSRGRGAKGRGKGKGNGRGQEEGSSKILGEGLVWVTVETCQVSHYNDCACNVFD